MNGNATCWRSECRTGCYYPAACSERPPCDVCGEPASTTDGICGNLCDQDTCYAIAWDHVFGGAA